MTGLLFTLLVLALASLYLFKLRIEKFCGHCGHVRRCRKRVEHTTWIWPIYYIQKQAMPPKDPEPAPSPNNNKPSPSNLGLGDPKPVPQPFNFSNVPSSKTYPTYPGAPSAGAPSGAPSGSQQATAETPTQGVVDISMIIDPTILESVRKEILPLLNNERACANTSLPTLEYDISLNDAAQKFAYDIVEKYLRTDYPHLSYSVNETVDARVQESGWKGLVGLGNVDQIIQFSTIQFDTNTPPYVLRDIMCAKSPDLKSKLLNKQFNRVGVGYARGNNDTPKPNVKSVYIIVLGTFGTTPALPAKSTNNVCIDWSIADVCDKNKAPPIINLPSL